MPEFTPFSEETLIKERATISEARYRKEEKALAIKRRLNQLAFLKEAALKAKASARKTPTKKQEEAKQRLEDFLEEKCFEDATLGLVSYNPFTANGSRFIGRCVPGRFLEKAPLSYCRVSGDFARFLATRDGELYGFPESTSLKKAFTRIHLMYEIKKVQDQALWELEFSGVSFDAISKMSGVIGFHLANGMSSEHAFLEALLRQAFLAGEFGDKFEEVPSYEELEISWGSIEDLEEDFEAEELLAQFL